jgi:hypothetical protein
VVEVWVRHGTPKQTFSPSGRVVEYQPANLWVPNALVFGRFRPDSFRGGNEAEWAGMRKAMDVRRRRLRARMEYLPRVGLYCLEGTTALFISASVDGYNAGNCDCLVTCAYVVCQKHS